MESIAEHIHGESALWNIIILVILIDLRSFFLRQFKVVITWSRLAGMKFHPALPGSWQCYILLINYILRLDVKCFIPTRRDPSYVQPGPRFPGTKFSNVIASTRLGGIKKLIKKISIEVHFNRSKIFLLYFYDSYDVILWEKKLTNIF